MFDTAQNFLNNYRKLRHTKSASGTTSLAIPADHEIAISLCFQPEQIRLGGDPPIHDHHSPCGRLEASQHILQRAGFGDIPGEHPGAAHKATAVQNQPQGDQGAIGALFLGVPARGFPILEGRGRSMLTSVTASAWPP
jgi:hypothetical protein